MLRNVIARIKTVIRRLFAARGDQILRISDQAPLAIQQGVGNVESRVGNSLRNPDAPPQRDVGLSPEDVFTPGAYPEHTYVDRRRSRARIANYADDHGDRSPDFDHTKRHVRSSSLEKLLADGLRSKGMIVSVAGPSKSGKTVLVERVAGVDRVICVTGAAYKTDIELWAQVLNQLRLPASQETGKRRDQKLHAKLSTGGSLDVLGVATGQVTAEGGAETSSGTSVSKMYERRGFEQVVEALANTDRVLFLDDFHYAPVDTRLTVVRSLKEAARRGVRVVTGTVAHLADDVIRANPELRGRVVPLDIPPWTEDELRQIAVKGFNALNTTLDSKSQHAFANESGKSPQLMQAICLTASRTIGQVGQIAGIVLTPEQRTDALRETGRIADFRTLLDVLVRGPDQNRVTGRQFSLADSYDVDIYALLLHILAASPPSLSFESDELFYRAKRLVEDEGASRDELNAAAAQLATLAGSRLPNERVFAWDEQRRSLEILDPHFIFYLRWSGRLEELSSGG